MFYPEREERHLPLYDSMKINVIIESRPASIFHFKICRFSSLLDCKRRLIHYVCVIVGTHY